MQGCHGQNLQCTVDLLELNLLPCAIGWLGSRVVSLLDSGASGPGFRSQPRRFRVTVLGKLRASVYLAAKLVTALLRVARVTADLVESNGSLLPAFVTHITCRLTAKNRNLLRNPTLCNRIWATFTFTSCYYGDTVRSVSGSTVQ